MPWLAMACWKLGWGKPDRESSSLRHSDKFLESPGLLLLLFKLLCCWEREAGGQESHSPSFNFYRHLAGLCFPKTSFSAAYWLRPKGSSQHCKMGPGTLAKDSILSPFSQQVAPTEQVERSSGLGTVQASGNNGPNQLNSCMSSQQSHLNL